MTMAKPGLAQDQTVEEILASIRQVINGDQSRSAASRPATGVMQTPRSPAAAPPPPLRGGTVTPIHGGKIVDAGDEALEDAAPEAVPADIDADEAPAAPQVNRSQMHDVIELAIEQALDKVDPDDTRAETVNAAPAEARPPLRAAVGMRATPQPDREVPRTAEPQPVREVPRAAAPQPAREAQRTFEAAPRPAPASRSLLSPRANAAVTASFDDLARALASHGSRNIDQTVEDLLKPMLKTWLEDNLPSLVERLVREEIERVSRGGR